MNLKLNLSYVFFSHKSHQLWHNEDCSVSYVQSHMFRISRWILETFWFDFLRHSVSVTPPLLPVHLLLIVIFIFQNSGRVSHLLLTEHSSHSLNPHQIHVSFFCLICVPLSLRWSTYLPLYPLPAALPHFAPLPRALSGPHIQTGFYSWEGRTTPQSPLCELGTLKTNKKH